MKIKSFQHAEGEAIIGLFLSGDNERFELMAYYEGGGSVDGTVLCFDAVGRTIEEAAKSEVCRQLASVLETMANSGVWYRFANDGV